MATYKLTDELLQAIQERAAYTDRIKALRENPDQLAEAIEQQQKYMNDAQCPIQRGMHQTELTRLLRLQKPPSDLGHRYEYNR